jgi:hypothetical protein
VAGQEPGAGPDDRPVGDPYDRFEELDGPAGPDGLHLDLALVEGRAAR